MQVTYVDTKYYEFNIKETTICLEMFSLLQTEITKATPKSINSIQVLGVYSGRGEPSSNYNQGCCVHCRL